MRGGRSRIIGQRLQTARTNGDGDFWTKKKMDAVDQEAEDEDES